MKRTLVSISIVLVLLFSMTAIAFADNPLVIEQIVTYEDTSVPIFRYTPADFNFRGNNTPLFFILGDKPYTVESAEKTLVENGIKDIADTESCSVIFVSPANGQTWSEEDYTAMQVLAGNATDNYFYGTDYSAGVSEEGKFFSGRFRHYIFAEGSAVDFAKQYLDVEGATYYLPEWFGYVDAFGAGYVYAPDGFSPDTIKEGWEAIRHTNRMYLNSNVTFLTPYYYWEEEGISETIATFETGVEAEPSVEYYLYIPDSIDITSETEKYPLVLVMHGSGMHPQAIAQNTTFPIVGAKEGFITVSVSGLYNAEEAAVRAGILSDLIDTLAAEYPIDTSRIYSTGFSKGAHESIALGTICTEKIAGIGLYEPVYTHVEHDVPKACLPIYSMIGEYDFYNIFPRDTEAAITSIQKFGESNGYTYSYDEAIGGFWGFNFDKDESIELPEERTTINEHSITSTDGVVYSKYIDLTDVSHNVVPATAQYVWDFLSQFSRNEDGSISVVEKTPAYTEEDIFIDAGDHQIPATVTIPAGEGPFPFVVMLHGNGSTRHEAGNAYDYTAPEMAKAGIATIRFDYIGNGDSTSDYIDFTYDKGVADAMACYEYMLAHGNMDKDRAGIMGWSQGGRLALLTAGRNDVFKSVLTWAGAYDQKGSDEEQYEIAKENGYYEVTYDWREPLKQSPEYYEVAMAIDYPAEVAAIKAPILAINGTEDTTVLPETAQKIIDASTNPESRVLLLDGADHTFLVFSGDLSMLEKLTEETIQWFADTL